MPRFQTVEDLPEELQKRAREAQQKIETNVDELRKLDDKIKAMDEEGSALYRKRCRTCRTQFTQMFDAQQYALRQLTVMFLRNGAGLQTAVDAEINRRKLDAQQNGVSGLDPRMLASAKLEVQSKLQIEASRRVLEADRFALNDQGIPERQGGSIIDGAVKSAVALRELLIKSRDQTVREIEMASLPKSLAGEQQSVAELMQQAESRQWVRALGPSEAMKWGLAQLESAMKAEDFDHVQRLEASVGPYAAELLRMSHLKIGQELDVLGRGPGVRAGTVDDLLKQAAQLTRTFKELREARVPRDAKLCLAILEELIFMWKRVCGQGDVRSLTATEFQKLIGSRSVSTQLEEISWRVDASYILRDAVGPEGAAALRSIPNMKEAVQAFDAKTIKSLRIGRSTTRGAS